MARMTATDFISISRASLGGETTETLTDAVLLRLANQSALELAAKYRLPELETYTAISATAGTYEYSISSTNLYITQIIDTTSNSELIKFHRSEFEDYLLGDLTSITGAPTHWCISGNSSGTQRIFLYPFPDGSYTLRAIYYKQPTEIVASPTATSFVDLHPAWDSVILDMTISKGWKYLGDMEKAAVFMQFAKDGSAAALKTSIYSSDVVGGLGSPFASATEGV